MPQLEDVIRAAVARAYEEWTDPNPRALFPEWAWGNDSAPSFMRTERKTVQSPSTFVSGRDRTRSLEPSGGRPQRAWFSSLRFSPVRFGLAHREIVPPGLEALLSPKPRRRLFQRVLAMGLVAGLGAWGLAALGTSMLAARRSVSVGGTILAVASGYRSVWILTCDRCSDPEIDTGTATGRLLRIDPRSARIRAVIHIRSPQGLAVGDGGVWIATGWASSLTRVDPDTDRVVATIPLALPFEVAPGDSQFGPQYLAAGAGAVWAGTARGVLARIDPRTNQVVATVITIPGAAGEIAAAEGGIWVAADVEGVLRVDSEANRILATIPVGTAERRLAIDGVVGGDGAVWAGGAWTTMTEAHGSADGTPAGYISAGTGAIARIDPRTSRVVATIGFRQAVTPVAAGRGVLWVESGGTLSRIDVRTNRVVGRPISPPGWVDPADGVVWIASGTDLLTGVPLAASSR